MKWFISIAILLMASMTLLTGCSEYDDNELRPVQTYQVEVCTRGDLSNADQASLLLAMEKHHVDTSSMHVTTDNLPALVRSMRLQLDGITTAMKIGFRLENISGNNSCVATIVLAGYEQ